MDQAQPEKARLQFMQSLIEGVTEEQFWQTFIQCISCRVVMIRLGALSVHKCNAANDDPRERPDRGIHRYRPYPAGAPNRRASSCLHREPSPLIITPHLQSLVGDAPESCPMSSIRSGVEDTGSRRSLTPTDILSAGSDSETDNE